MILVINLILIKKYKIVFLKQKKERNRKVAVKLSI